jgi:hypothetical protein
VTQTTKNIPTDITNTLQNIFLLTKHSDFFPLIRIVLKNYLSLLSPKYDDVQKYISMEMREELKLRGLSPRADYTDRAAAAGRRS